MKPALHFKLVKGPPLGCSGSGLLLRSEQVCAWVRVPHGTQVAAGRSLEPVCFPVCHSAFSATQTLGTEQLLFAAIPSGAEDRSGAFSPWVVFQW